MGTQVSQKGQRLLLSIRRSKRGLISFGFRKGTEKPAYFAHMLKNCISNFYVRIDFYPGFGRMSNVETSEANYLIIPTLVHKERRIWGLHMKPRSVFHGKSLKSIVFIKDPWKNLYICGDELGCERAWNQKPRFKPLAFQYEVEITPLSLIRSLVPSYITLFSRDCPVPVLTQFTCILG